MRVLQNEPMRVQVTNKLSSLIEGEAALIGILFVSLLIRCTKHCVLYMVCVLLPALYSICLLVLYQAAKSFSFTVKLKLFSLIMDQNTVYTRVSSEEFCQRHRADSGERGAC